jgi:hypothetical protein
MVLKERAERGRGDKGINKKQREECNTKECNGERAGIKGELISKGMFIKSMARAQSRP